MLHSPTRLPKEDFRSVSGYQKRLFIPDTEGRGCFENHVLAGEFHPWQSGCEIVPYMEPSIKIHRHFEENVRTMLRPSHWPGFLF
jgi:hypothetical protein